MKKTKAIKCILGLIALSYLVHISKLLFWLWERDLIGVDRTIYADWSCVIWNAISTIALIILLILILTEK